MSGDATTPGGSSALAPSTRRAYVYPGSGSEALRKHLLAHLAALAALGLCLAEQRGQLLVALSSGVLDVLLEAQRIRERLLGEPDQVVVLVLRAGDLTGLLCRRHGSSWSVVRLGVPGSRLRVPGSSPCQVQNVSGQTAARTASFAIFSVAAFTSSSVCCSCS